MRQLLLDVIVQMALHQKSGSDARGGSPILNKPPLPVVACNFCAGPVQIANNSGSGKIGIYNLLGSRGVKDVNGFKSFVATNELNSRAAGN